MNAQILLTFRMGEYGEGLLAADILGGQPDVFTGRLSFLQPRNLAQAAQMLGGTISYPADLKENGFDTEQNAEGSVQICYRVSKQEVTLVVALGKNPWEWDYGETRFSLDGIKGGIQCLGGNKKQFRFWLEGRMSFGRCRAKASLQLGAGDSPPPTLLSFTLASDNQEKISISDLIEGISGRGSYQSLKLPEEYRRPEDACRLEAKLNLTAGTFLLQGSYQFNETTQANAVLYFSKQKEGLSYWLGAQLKDFSLSDISSALEGAQEFLGLDKASAAVFLSGMDQKIPDSFRLPQFFIEIFPKEIKKGLTFQAELSFSNSFIKEVLEISSGRIWGFIPQDKNEALLLSGSCDSIVFLSTLTITKVKAVLERGGDGVFLFTASGTSTINLGGDSGELSCKVDLSISKKEDGERNVALDGKLGNIREPLGMPKTTIENLGIYAFASETAKDEEDTSCSLRGEVEIAQVRLTAEILFGGQTPTVVEIGLSGEEKLSISGLADKYLGLAWPEYLDIEFYEGSIYYAVEDVRIRGKLYQKGFCASLHTKIFALPPLRLSVLIGAADITASAQFEEAIDLFFIRFSLPGQEAAEKGPRVSIIVGKESRFSLSTDVTFLEVPLGNVKIDVRKKGMQGRLTFPAQRPISGSVEFEWNEEGFSLKECPISFSSSLDFDLPKVDIKTGGKCGFSTSDSLKIEAKPDVRSKGLKTQGDCFTLNFDFILHLKSEAFPDDEAFFDLTFRDYSISVNKEEIEEPDFKSFMKILGENIISLAAQTFEKVLEGEIFQDAVTQENMEKLIKFLTIQGMKWGVEQLLNYLICRLGSRAAAYGLIAAITGGGSWEWGAVALAVVGVIGEMGDDDSFQVKKKAQKKNPDPKKNPDTPDPPTLSFDNDRLRISWTACKNATGYSPVVVRILEKGEKALVLSSCQETCCEIDGTSEDSLYKASYGYPYKVKINAWNDEGCATGEERELYLLSCPNLSKVLYRCEDKSLCIGWDALKGAREYEAVVEWQEETQTRRLTMTCTPDKREAVFRDFAPERLVNVYVRGKAEHVVGPATAFEPLYLYDLAAPKVTESYAGEEGIVLLWERVPYAGAYWVSCLNEAGEEVYTADTAENSICIPEAYLKEDTGYYLQLWAHSEEIEGNTSDKRLVLWYQLPVPEIRELICGEDGSLLFELSVNGRDYSHLVMEDGWIVNLTDSSYAYKWDIGKTARIRLEEDKRNGKWSGEISVEPIKTPKNMRLNVTADRLSVGWEETGEEVLYKVELRAGKFFLASGPVNGSCWDCGMEKIPKEERVYVTLFCVDRCDERRHSKAVQSSFERR